MQIQDLMPSFLSLSAKDQLQLILERRKSRRTRKVDKLEEKKKADKQKRNVKEAIRKLSPEQLAELKKKLK